MDHSGSAGRGGRSKSPSGGFGELSPEHYLRIILHRKWLILACAVVVSAGTFTYSLRLPDVYSSETLIMVDPQKVPDSYVKATVSGDIRNRLGTLSQQILSATRLQKIIDTLNLYPEERKVMPREDVIALMRRDIVVQVVGEFGSSQDLQAFRIRYNGKEPRIVAQVTNQLASLFIEENLKAREQQASGTEEFLHNQLEQTRKQLEQQESKLRDFKLRHIGEMPEQQASTLQILGQLQSQLQLESEALNRAEQQKTYIQSIVAGPASAPAVDLDQYESKPVSIPAVQNQVAKAGAIGVARARLAALQGRYTEDHPEVRRLRKQIEDEEAAAAKRAAEAPAVAAAPVPASPAPVNAERFRPPVPAKTSNPVLDSQLRTLEKEIADHQSERQRLLKQIAQYRARLEAVPLREQQIAEVIRDYEISKAHYKSLLEKELSAETATQLEIRQKGERFTVLDPAQAAEKPSSPNRKLINAGGSLVGLVLGLILALITEFLGISITGPEQIVATTGLTVLEVIPVIYTHSDRLARRRRLVIAFASFAVCLAGGAVLLYHYRDRVF